MKTLLAILCALMQSCATRMWDPVTGHKTFETYGDVTDMYWDGKKFTAKRLNHSIPTRNAMTGATGLVTEGAAAVIGGGLP